MWYEIAKPSEYLVITGMGINDIKLAKKGWVFPMQQVRRFDITPMNYTFEVQAMSEEKLAFTLPAVFTIGPRDEEPALILYAKLIAEYDMTGPHVNELIKGVVEGETRVLAAGMTMENVFKDTRQFKQEVFSKVQVELNQFGLHIYNANIKQLVDVPGLEYFSYFGKSKQQEAANKAKVDVAEANYKGNTGAKVREGLTMQEAAKVDAKTAMVTNIQKAEARQLEMKMDAETKVYQNRRQAEIAEANASLALQTAKLAQQTKIADIEANRAAAKRDAEMEKEVEQRKAMAETERLRGQVLSKATVDYEVSVQITNANLYQKQKEADAALYLRQQQAEALQIEADSSLYAKQKEAEGILALAKAHASYARSMVEAFDGNYRALHDYLMIDRKVYQEMGEINARAIKGLEPKMSIWSTSNSTDGLSNTTGNGGALAQPIADIYRMIPPLLTTVQEQTGQSFDMPTINVFSSSPSPPLVTEVHH